jgi:hypothetical protein
MVWNNNTWIFYDADVLRVCYVGLQAFNLCLRA